VTKIQEIRAELGEAVETYLVGIENRIVGTKVEVTKEAVRDLEAEKVSGDGFMKWKPGSQLVIKATVELRPKD
jgi:hypothetical protein